MSETLCTQEKRITLTRGRDAEFTLYINDRYGRPIVLTGWTFIQVRLPKDSSGAIEKHAPESAGTDEVQSIAFSDTPDAGVFKLKAGTETTAQLAFNSNAAAVQTALRDLLQFSALTVAGAFPTFTVSFVGDDGKREQPLLEIVESTLQLAGVDVEAEVTKTTTGAGKSGVEVLNEAAAALRVFLNEADTAQLKAGLSQSFELKIRLGAQDLNIPPILNQLDVLDSPF